MSVLQLIIFIPLGKRSPLYYNTVIRFRYWEILVFNILVFSTASRLVNPIYKMLDIRRQILMLHRQEQNAVHNKFKYNSEAIKVNHICIGFSDFRFKQRKPIHTTIQLFSSSTHNCFRSSACIIII